MSDSRGGISIVIAVPIKKAFNDGELIDKCTSDSSAIRLPNYNGQNYQMKEQQTRTANGMRYEAHVTGTIPSNCIKDSDIQRLRSGSFAVFCKSNQSICTETGSEIVPLRCNLEMRSGSSPENINGYDFDFYGINDHATQKCFDFD